MIDHFNGNALTGRAIEWLRAALADAERKAADCEAPQESDGRTFPAHANMWRGIADRYRTEIAARQMPVSTSVEHGPGGMIRLSYQIKVF